MLLFIKAFFYFFQYSFTIIINIIILNRGANITKSAV